MAGKGNKKPPHLWGGFRLIMMVNLYFYLFTQSFVFGSPKSGETQSILNNSRFRCFNDRCIGFCIRLSPYEKLRSM